MKPQTLSPAERRALIEQAELRYGLAPGSGYAGGSGVAGGFGSGLGGFSVSLGSQGSIARGLGGGLGGFAGIGRALVALGTRETDDTLNSLRARKAHVSLRSRKADDTL
jgi:hypothetical protein